MEFLWCATKESLLVRIINTRDVLVEGRREPVVRQAGRQTGPFSEAD